MGRSALDYRRAPIASRVPDEGVVRRALYEFQWVPIVLIPTVVSLVGSGMSLWIRGWQVSRDDMAVTVGVGLVTGGTSVCLLLAWAVLRAGLRQRDEARSEVQKRRTQLIRARRTLRLARQTGRDSAATCEVVGPFFLWEAQQAESLALSVMRDFRGDPAETQPGGFGYLRGVRLVPSGSRLAVLVVRGEALDEDGNTVKLRGKWQLAENGPFVEHVELSDSTGVVNAIAALYLPPPDPITLMKTIQFLLSDRVRTPSTEATLPPSGRASI